MDLVVCSLEAWDEVWRRNQYLVAGLLDQRSDLRVLFVEPPVDLLHNLRAGRRRVAPRGLLQRNDIADGRLWTFQAGKIVPRVLGGFADRTLTASVQSAARKVGFERPVLWVNDPLCSPMLAATGWPALYDITDDWLRADRPARILRRLRDSEAVLMRGCREVVVCSPSLAHDKCALRPVHLIPNAVDLAAYREVTPRPVEFGDERCAVYVGTLHEDRLDVDLCVDLAAALRPGEQLFFVGPNALGKQSSERLSALRSVSILGARAHDSIPAYLQHAEVLVVPHAVTPFTDSLDPIKLYEYRASARPLVSTPVAGFRELAADHVTIATGAPFVSAVLAALRSESKPMPVDESIPTWTDRTRQMAQVLDSVTAAG
jgi:teichuronic acid biosynthesis glycosyltransferase TuaH